MLLDALDAKARAALTRARERPLSYVVRYLATPGADRILVILGEAHLKLAEASEVGKAVVDAFPLRGVETFPVNKVAGGRALWLVIHVPRLLLRKATLGFVKDSTIVDAKALRHGHTVEIEATSPIPLGLHVGAVYMTTFFSVFWGLLGARALGLDALTRLLTPIALAFELHMLALVPAWLLRKKSWAWMVHPGIAILTMRDATMVEGTLAMLRDHPEPRIAVVVMGRAHVGGFERRLVEEHGFVRLDD
jgi:hypothetical protein